MKRLADRDLLTALVLFGIAAVFSSGTTTDVKDWIFPQLANYVILAVGVTLLARFLLAGVLKRAPDFVDGVRENWPAIIDLLVFCLIVLAYVFVMNGLGFWLASFLMLTLTSVYLTQDKTRRNLTLAVAMPLGVCIVAYFVFLRVFYVPVPEATWWLGV